jgi:hypothetical protein
VICYHPAISYYCPGSYPARFNTLLDTSGISQLETTSYGLGIARQSRVIVEAGVLPCGKTREVLVASLAHGVCQVDRIIDGLRGT